MTRISNAAECGRTEMTIAIWSKAKANNIFRKLISKFLAQMSLEQRNKVLLSDWPQIKLLSGLL